MGDILKSIDLIFHFQLFEINQTPVTLSSVFMFLLIFIIFFVSSRLLEKLLLRKFLTRMQVDEGKAFTMARITHYLIMISGTIVAFQFVGVDLSGLAVIFGLLSVGIGFGLQNVTSNFISGIILLLERPIKIGDRVTVGGTEGDVTAINIRSTTIRSLNNISIIVPNSEFVSSQVVNWSHGDTRVRLDIHVGVSYNSDLDTVIKALLEAAAESNILLKNPKPDVLFDEFGDSAWNMRLRVWLKDPTNFYATRSVINCAIVQKFRHYGVEIPFPQRDLHVRSPLPVPLRTEANN